MFETISEKFQVIFKTLRGHHRISEANITDSLREIRKALLEADVSYTIVRDFIKEVKEKSLGEKVLDLVSPGQMMTKIIYDEMVRFLSMGACELPLDRSFQTLMIVGLQGCGKTTTCAKLAFWFKEKGLRTLLVGADAQRPAAKEQLRTLAGQTDVDFFTLDEEKNPLAIVHAALKKAKDDNLYHRMVVDTAGRLHVDEELMKELTLLSQSARPDHILLTTDAMLGQDSVKTGEAFSRYLNLTGIILTKMDGDARGGAAMSMAAVTGKSVQFVGTGEKISQFEPFYPDRMASRILGMGDILTLVEKAKETVDEKEAKKLETKIRKNDFDLEDFLSAFQQIKKMGSLQSLLQMIPGMPKVDPKDLDEGKMKHIEAIIHSMTPKERGRPGIINGNRKKRISRGCGRSVEEINRLLKDFREMKFMMKRMQPLLQKMPGKFN
ncbi:MAG: signal recognition particle protein [Candidatus Aureabacteria bacterium]|nr:signal recognition particle protein [Candidatus Auribacterota bacterium]